MSPPELKVTPDGLRALVQRCQELAGQLSASLPTVTASAWQSSGTAASAINASANRAATAMRARMMSTGNKVSKAAHDYENQDGQAGAAIGRVGIPTTAGGHTGTDGGAGGTGAAPPAGPPPVHAGADGGAGGTR